MMSAPLHTEKTVFLEAAEIASPTERAAFLERSCGDDRQLRAAVEALLLSHQRSQGVLDTAKGPLAEHLETIIGPYKLLQQIGEGGMGTVFMAEQTEPIVRKVALKIIKPGMDSRQVIARFEAERQALAMMDHVNIARVLDAGTTPDGLPYFVMELVHGVPITKYCDDNHLTPRQRLELFVPVCQAIQHAHQKGIIHRDIKPSNVMVTLYDGKPVPKVIDFGVAKAIEQKLTERTLFTQFGTMVGTLEYMSPEQAEMSALGVDTRSDIYSLGVLLYELLTGSTPLSNKRMKEAAYAEILRMIREEEPPKPSTRLSESGEALASISALRHTEPAKLAKLVRGELDWIVMKTLEKDRNRRYETANGFAADVQRYLNDDPVLACPPSAGYRLRKFATRNKTALIMSALVVFALVAGTAVSTWEAIRATRARQETEVALAREAKLRKEAEARGRIDRAERLCGTNEFDQAERLMREVPDQFIQTDANACARIFGALANWNGGERRYQRSADLYDMLLFGPAKKGLDLNPYPLTMTYLEYAPLLVELHDQARYEKFRESIIATRTDDDGNRGMLTTCLILPANERQMTALGHWAEITAKSSTNVWDYATLALFEFRRGNDKRALEWSQKCVSPAPPPSIVRSHIVMAMVYFRLDRHDEAQTELTQSRKMIEREFTGRTGMGSSEVGFWWDWLIAQTLLREAERLLAGHSAVQRRAEVGQRMEPPIDASAVAAGGRGINQRASEFIPPELGAEEHRTSD
jgi:serine/threonine protein kinase